MADIKEELYKPFDDIKSRKGRGGTYDYVSWKDIADRMNEVFGMNWSSSVVEQEMLNDQVIIRVSVCAKDPISNELFCQEGFGGSQLRNSDEAGSAHKGAYSKALKDACKKWGIGLHLVEDGQPSGGYQQQTTPPSGPQINKSLPPSINQGPPTNTNQAPPSNTAPTLPSGFTGRETAPAPSNTPPTGTQNPVNSGPPTPPDQGAPPVSQAPASQGIPPTPPSIPSSTTSVADSIDNSGFPPVPPNIPVNNQPSGPTAPINEPNTDVPGSINNVQEMAIKNLARLGNFETPELLVKSLADKPDNEVNRAVDGVKELSYDEAVMVIKTAKNPPKTQ